MIPKWIPIDGSRLTRELKTLSGFSSTGPDTGVTRLAWTDEYLRAQEWLRGRMAEAGLQVHVDAAGNLWGIWKEGELPAVVTGSHIDSVPSGGMFDGCLGVVAGLEAVRALKQAGLRPERQIRLVAWMEEEGSRFGIGLFGSKAIVGALDLDEIRTRTSADGARLEDVLGTIGSNRQALAELPNGLRELGAYVELHIEQGPILEREGLEIGVVTHIVGLDCLRIELAGCANHAGTTPMDARRDAGIGAARAIAAARDLAVAQQVRATAGQVRFQPGASNVIPGRASFTLDVRHHDPDRLREYEEALKLVCRRIADEEALDVSIEAEYRLAPASLDPGLTDHIRRATTTEKLACMDMVSGGGHDAMALAAHVPAGMIFVPSRGGLSHTSQEFTTPEHCAAGARVLARVLAQLTDGGSGR